MYLRICKSNIMNHLFIIIKMILKINGIFLFCCYFVIYSDLLKA